MPMHLSIIPLGVNGRGGYSRRLPLRFGFFRLLFRRWSLPAKVAPEGPYTLCRQDHPVRPAISMSCGHSWRPPLLKDEYHACYYPPGRLSPLL
jgi:hypothetical protein